MKCIGFNSQSQETKDNTHMNGWSKFQVTCGCMDFSSATQANKAKNRLKSLPFFVCSWFFTACNNDIRGNIKGKMIEKILKFLFFFLSSFQLQKIRNSSRHCPINVITRLLHFKISLIILFFNNKKENF